ncbi:MAG: putative maltokinase, partial [Actinobacteria bacterium]|nr:putative maltokinase [Actinomycetota bacterium]
PGTPVVYYGDEIGMGDNIYLGDRNGVRTPMQWSADRNAGFSMANPQKLYLPVIIDPEYHASAVNVEAQQANPHSLLWWMKRVIALRRRYRAFGRGTLEFLHPANRKVLAFLRAHEDERILVVANLSRFAQYVELDLSSLKGMVPVELFGGSEFPPIGDLPYLLTLSPHAFYWFALEPQEAGAITVREEGGPTIEVAGRWDELITTKARSALEGVLPRYLVGRRWFGGKARRISGVEVLDAVPVPRREDPASDPAGYLALLQVEYQEGDPERYVLPLAVFPPDAEDGRDAGHPAAIATLRTVEGERVLFDAIWDADFALSLLEACGRRRRLSGAHGKVVAQATSAFRRILRAPDGDLSPTLLGAEQSNTSVAFGDRLILKMFRRPGEGTNPDLEIGRFLTERARFPHSPPVAGSLEYRWGRGPVLTLGTLHGYVPNEGDAWSYTLDVLRDFMERVLTSAEGGPAPDREPTGVLDLVGVEPPRMAEETIGSYLESARLLGQRTGELHAALASDREDPDFRPEPFTPLYQRSVYQSMRNLTDRVFAQLRSRAEEIPAAGQILDLQKEVMARFQRLLEGRISGVRLRLHGDYHLGQVLYTGRDFVIIDFEGEPAVPLGERRIKRSPLRDVAGMLRSFHYAAYSSLIGPGQGVVGQEDSAALEPWILFWNRWVSAAFLGAYLDAAGPGGILPETREEVRVVLEAMLLEKAVYEVGYEINNRPDWVKIPIQGIVQLLEDEA